jgi:O-antigen ligase
MLESHPVLGVGYFNFPPYFQEHYRDLVLYEHAQLPHNIIIQVGSELGYVGLFVYALLILNCFIKKSRREDGGEMSISFMRALPYSLNVSIIGFFIAGQFVSVVYYPFMWIHLALAAAVINVSAKESAQKASLKGVGQGGR